MRSGRYSPVSTGSPTADRARPACWRRRLAPLLLLFLLGGEARAFQAGKLNFYLSGDLLFQNNRATENDRPGQHYGTLSLFANLRRWSAGITLRGNNFFKQAPNLTLDPAHFDLYRKFVQYDSRHLKLTLGDFYAQLGRGLVLSVLKNEDVRRERTIAGGDVRYVGDSLDWRLLAGKVVDETASREWSLAAGEVNVEYLKHQRIGARFSWINDIINGQNLNDRQTGSISLNGAQLFDSVSYVVEMAFLGHIRPLAWEKSGRALYAGATYSRAHWLLTLEYKRYRNFDNGLNNPPVADRAEEAYSAGDASGGRLYAQYSFFNPDVTVFCNYGRYREDAAEGDHVYAGVRIEDLWQRLDASLTYGVRDIRFAVKRLDGQLTWRFSGRVSLELALKDRRYVDGSFVFQETDQQLQFSCSPHFFAHIMHQFSHNQVLGLNHFYSGGVRFNPSPQVSIELAGGTVRGGQTCSGGQCFVAPPFKGLMCSLFFTLR